MLGFFMGDAQPIPYHHCFQETILNIYATFQHLDMDHEREIDCGSDIKKAICIADNAIEDGGFGQVDVFLLETENPVQVPPQHLCDVCTIINP